MSEQVIYAKACAERKPEYRQQTLIIRKDGKMLVRKLPVGTAATGHIRQYAENYGKLTGALRPGARVSAVSCSLNADGSVDFPFLEDPTLQDRLAGLPAGAYAEEIVRFRDALAEAFGEEPFAVTDAFVGFFGCVPVPDGMTALKVTNADMTFDNVFCAKDGTYTFIDYEWILPFPVPLQFLLWRALPQDPAWNSFSQAEQETVLTSLGISPDMAGDFRQMEGAFLDQVSPDEYKLDTFARLPGKRHNMIHELDRLMAAQEENEKLKAECQEHNYWFGKKWFRFGRRADNAARRVRNRVRTFARGDNFAGCCCSFVLLFFREGPSAAWEKVVVPRRGHRVPEWLRRQLGRPGAIQPGGSVSPQDDVKISVLVPLFNTPAAFLEEMVNSVRAQTYTNWELCLADGSDEDHAEVGELCGKLAEEDPRIRCSRLKENRGISENTNACIDMAGGDYLALLDHDDVLRPEALAEAVRAIREEGADFVYTDEAVFASPDTSDLVTFHFKPDWSPEKLLTNNYICHLSVFRASLLDKAGRFRPACDGSQDYDLILRLTDSAEKVVHIPKVLYLWRSHGSSTASDISAKPFAVNAGMTALKDFMRTRRQTEVSVESAPEYPTLYHVKYPLRKAYRADLILDLAGRTPEEAGRILQAVRQNTAYPWVFLLVIADSEPAAGRLPWPVRRIRAEGRTRVERLNAAAEAAEGDFLVFLDAGLVPQSREWLQEMIMIAQQDEAGAVGGKSFFEDERVRCGGLTIGLGRNRLAGRICFRMEEASDGYFGQLSVVGNVSAVPAECMAVSRAKFNACGGFDPDYAGTLYDADLCLKLRDLGYRNLFTPFALFRGGNAKRFFLDYGKECDTYRADAETFRRKRKQDLSRPDPYYNPNLTLDRGDYSIRKQAF